MVFMQKAGKFNLYAFSCDIHFLVAPDEISKQKQKAKK